MADPRPVGNRSRDPDLEGDGVPLGAQGWTRTRHCLDDHHRGADARDPRNGDWHHPDIQPAERRGRCRESDGGDGRHRRGAHHHGRRADRRADSAVPVQCAGGEGRGLRNVRI